MSKLVCEACGSRALSAIETDHNATSRREVYECEDCEETGILSYDASSGIDLSGCLTLQPTPKARPFEE